MKAILRLHNHHYNYRKWNFRRLEKAENPYDKITNYLAIFLISGIIIDDKKAPPFVTGLFALFHRIKVGNLLAFHFDPAFEFSDSRETQKDHAKLRRFELDFLLFKLVHNPGGIAANLE